MKPILPLAALITSGATLATLFALTKSHANPVIQPQAAPELQGKIWLQSRPTSLQKRRGKVTILHFWNIGCSDCQANLPAYNQLQKQFQSRGVEVIGVHTPLLTLERDLQNVAQFLREKKIKGPVLLDSESVNWKSFGVTAHPTFFVIDGNGQIRHKGEGGLSSDGERIIAAVVEKLLAENRGPRSANVPPTVEKIALSEGEWARKLSPAAFQILRKHGTEAPFSGALNNEKRAGTFFCGGCDLPLFSSQTKFDSGTGWPSFYAPLAPRVVRETTDESHGMKRVEISCARCGGHLGHVFNDGPMPTGLRYCMNSAALTFEEVR